MTRKQDLIVKTFRQLVRDAQDEGLHVVVDSDAMAIRLIPDEEYNNHRADIRGCGVKIPVHDACGDCFVKVGNTGNTATS